MNTGNSRGFSLIEVMVAVLVMSLGLLGVASTLIVALHSSGSNYLKQQAVQDSYDIVDRMRANFSAANDSGASNPYITALTAPSASTPSPDCTASVCTSAQMAAYDVWQWKTLLKSTLPDGLGQIAVTPAGPTGNLPKITVTVKWSDQPAQATFNPAGSSSSSLVVVTAL
jgi:type IV pilus assembly protein PilV